MSDSKLARKARFLRWALNFYPPYLGAGISVQQISPDCRQARVKMALRWYNRNAVGTQFGGSLYSMVDPFYMLLLMPLLGDDYLVWDQAASIEFIAPGKGSVYADFAIGDELLADIRAHTAAGKKYLPQLHVEVRDGEGTLVARVHKTLYVRLKPRARQVV
jgi:acyl-coenzyme A thioesterase PaaI-like protein